MGFYAAFFLCNPISDVLYGALSRYKTQPCNDTPTCTSDFIGDFMESYLEGRMIYEDDTVVCTYRSSERKTDSVYTDKQKEER